MRTLAQALMIEGVKQLQAKAYDQALANFLEAYAKFPSPKILLNIALHAARHGPARRRREHVPALPRTIRRTGAERIAEVKELLARARRAAHDPHACACSPRGSDVSIDGGPFIPVGAVAA